MKKRLIPLLVGFSTAVLLTGCAISIGDGKKNNPTSNGAPPAVGQATTAPTLGQQLIDLQKAKDAGVISDAEYQAQKAKLLENK
jgi:hypothetical protein